MSSLKDNLGKVILVVIAIVIVGFAISSVANIIFPPKYASYDDEIFENIGGDGILNATLKGCYKLGEENIPNANFNTSFGSYVWMDAKNITYLDTSGRKDYMIVWKCPANNYQEFSGNGILYISDYLVGGNDGRCFMLYNPDNQMAYGIVMDSDNISCSESKLMYDVLGLNSSQYSLLNVQPSQSYSGGGYSGSGGSGHYHTVVPDRYTLSRTDPGAYYDHYEYGDNYEIDDYLESEGYD